MKKNCERNFIRIFPYTLFFVFAMLVAGCDSEAVTDTPEELFGTWHQVSQSTDGTQTLKDSTRMLIQINSNQICILCDSTAVAVKTNKVVKRSGWSYSGELFNLAIDMPVSWKPVVDSNTLTLEKIEFNQAGAIKKTTQVYHRISDIEIN